MNKNTFILFMNGSFEDHGEINFFCMEIMKDSPAIKELKYVIETNNNVIVIFDSEYEKFELIKELSIFMINDFINYYFLFQLNTMITAHLPENLKDFIFKPQKLQTVNDIKTTESHDLDEILEKITEVGFSGLTEDEKKFLKNFSN